jgi:hypothetical protein
MRNALRSEWRKVTTTKLWWALLLAALAVAGVSAAGLISSYQTGAPPGMAAPPDPLVQSRPSGCSPPWVPPVRSSPWSTG